MTGINAPLNRPLRMALVGGAGAAFIGRVHATAATLDRRTEIVAGALSSNADKCKAAAPEFGISARRAYGSYTELIERELQLPAEQRAEFISIATPNHTHYPIAKAALEAGLHVVCDKPMTTSVPDAESLVEHVKQSGLVFALTHNYSGYPMVRQARAMIESGELGEIIAVRTNYIQGWLWGLEPGSTPPRGAWKSDPKKAGSGSLGDVGTHAYHLTRFVTQLLPNELSCLMKTYREGRSLDDYGHVMIRFANGATGLVTFSQVSHGRLNDLTLEVDGTKASLSWRQEEPNQLVVRQLGKPTQTIERNPMADFTHDLARSACRIPAGHPEAFFEAFANIYRNAFDDMTRSVIGESVENTNTIYPNVLDGLEGVRFIEMCQTSNAENSSWTQFG